MRKSRFLYLHPEANAGKIASLEALQEAYTVYLGACVEALLSSHRFSVSLKEKREFFPSSEVLSSQIVKNVQDHAISLVSSWAASKYTVKLKGFIQKLFREGQISEATRAALCIIGKCQKDKPSGKVTQEALDLYWTFLLDEGIVGRTPQIHSRGMRMSEMTAVLATSEETELTTWWLGFSHLSTGKPRIQLPLVPSPYAKEVSDVSKGVLARKTRNGRWRFEVVDKKEWEVPDVSGDLRIGVDVGLNVMAATSSGMLLGENLKPKFNRLYEKVKALRGNRQRQNLKENSKKLDLLESKLTGLVKTLAGEASNKLVKAYPDHTFVIEDLDLRGCRGQKRFAYRALHHSLESKAQVIKVNPAYSSQTCPSCGYVHRGNRSGVKFKCRSCGRISHADVVGGINLLRRSEDKQVALDDDPSLVRTILKERYLHRRSSPSRGESALEPSSLKLTTKASPRKRKLGTASN